MRSITSLLALCLLAANAAAQSGQEPAKQPPSDSSGAKKAAERMEAAKSRIKKTGETDYTLGSIQFSSATREVRVPALVNMSKGILEYALVHEHGKTHESLLRTPVSPTELNVALLLCHYEPHLLDAAKYVKDPEPETKARMAQPMEHEGANRVRLTVTWKDKTGQEHQAPLSDWIENRKVGNLWNPGHWTYTGSFISSTGFAAESDGSLIAIYFDLIALLNCPDAGNSDDERWFVNTTSIPAQDTPVTLVFSPIPSTAGASTITR
ncbi:MAG: YdjY domain-containing protein [Roseimicrobium sp.]